MSNTTHQWRTVGQRIGGAPSGKVTNARERSDQARGSEATERGEGLGGGVPPSQGREIFQFWGQNRVIWCMQ